jgi:hypothetical protein
VGGAHWLDSKKLEAFFGGEKREKAHGEVVVDHHNFALGHVSMIHDDVYGFTSQAVQLNHLFGLNVDEVVEFHAGGAQLDAHRHVNVLELLEVERAAWRLSILDFHDALLS